MRGWLALAALLAAAACGGGGQAAPATTSNGDLPSMIGADDCGGCRLTRGQCSAFFADESGGEGHEVPCDASCCAGPPAP